MTTPWNYTGQSVPRRKQSAGTAATEHPARVVSDSVNITTPKRNDKEAQAGMAGAQTIAHGLKERATKGGTPKQLWPTTEAVDRQVEVLAAQTPVRIKASKTGSRALMQNTRFQSTGGQDDDPQHKTKEPSGNVHTRTNRGLVERERQRSGPNDTANGHIYEKGGDYRMTAARLLTLTYNAGVVTSSVMVLKELLLPKLLVYMPIITCYVKKKMLSMRIAMMRYAEHGARLYVLTLWNWKVESYGEFVNFWKTWKRAHSCFLS